MKNETAITDTDDRNGQTCTTCGTGYYAETSIHDDWDGVLHCSNKKCNHEVKRYKSKDNPSPKLEKPKLTSAAQAVLDAYEESNDCYREEWGQLAAAIRAVADQVVPMGDYNSGEVMLIAMNVRTNLLAIAAELEGR
jgi:hypothetical protein